MKQGNHGNEQFHFISAKYKQNIDNIIQFWIKELRVLHPTVLTENNNVLMYIFFHSVYS
jgi:hypothetical protein